MILKYGWLQMSVSNEALLVAKGFHQQQGLNYEETFSHVIKSFTIRVVFCIAMSRG